MIYKTIQKGYKISLSVIQSYPVPQVGFDKWTEISGFHVALYRGPDQIPKLEKDCVHVKVIVCSLVSGGCLLDWKCANNKNCALLCGMLQHAYIDERFFVFQPMYINVYVIIVPVL